MTTNQIRRNELAEQSRSNRAKESQAASELHEKKRSNRAQETETKRSNTARETEERRSNMAKEQNTRDANTETRRSNQARERETNRSNIANEAIKRVQASNDTQRVSMERQLLPYDKLEKTVGAARNIADPLIKGLTLATNDPKWYTPSEQRLRDVASLPVSSVSGVTMPRLFGRDGQIIHYRNPAGAQSASIEVRSTDDSLLGIFALDYTPTFGSIDPLNDNALQTATQLLFMRVTQKSGRTSDYESSDLLIYAICIASLHSIIGEMHRLWECLNTYSGDSAFFGRRLTEALGYDYDDFIANAGNFRNFMNSFIDRASVFPVFPELYFDDHWYHLARNVYTDDVDSARQLYVTVPSGWYRWENERNGNATSVARFVPNNAGVTKLKYIDVVNKLNVIIEALLYDTDINMMRADILNASTYDSTITMSAFAHSYFTDSDKLTLLHDRYFLSQIKNAILLGTYPTTDDVAKRYDIFSNTENGHLECEFVASGTNHDTTDGLANVLHSLPKVIDNWPITSNFEDITPVDIIESTRFVAFPEAAGIVRDVDVIANRVRLYWNVESITAEIGYPVPFVTWFDSNFQSFTANSYYHGTALIADSEASESATFMAGHVAGLTAMQQLKYAPTIYYTYDIPAFNTGEIGGYGYNPTRCTLVPLVQLDRFSSVNREQLETMNATSIRRLLGIPFES